MTRYVCFQPEHNNQIKKDARVARLLLRALSALEIINMKSTFIIIGLFLSPLVLGAENSGPTKALSAYMSTLHAQRITKPGFTNQITSWANIDPSIFLGNARSQFRAGKFREAIASLNIYLDSASNDTLALLIRAQAKKLIEPPDVEGSCVDFLEVSSDGFDLSVVADIESFCMLEPGWDGR